MEHERIIHFDATARRRDKMQQAAREGGPQRSNGAHAAPPAPPSRQPDLEPAVELELTQQASEQTQEIADPAPASPAAAPVDQAGLETFLINFVVEQTGYPEDIVELDADLEADLGIDSIKKAQMFGELREHFEFDMQSASELSLDDFPTLRHIVSFLAAAGGGSAIESNEPSDSASPALAPETPAVEPAETCSDSNMAPAAIDEPEPPAPADSADDKDDNIDNDDNHADLESFLVNFVVEQTGYPPELVELDADLEADLGIDSIKKAQMFGELREVFAFEVESAEGLSLSDFPTLRHILEFLKENIGGAPSELACDGPSATCGPLSETVEDRSSDDGGLAWKGSPVATDASIVDSLRRILIEQGIADPARVNMTRQTRLMDDIGLDSIGMLDLVQAVEKEFGIAIELDNLDLRGLNSAAAFAALIQRKLTGLA